MLRLRRWVRDFICDEITGLGFPTAMALVGWLIVPSRHFDHSSLFLISIFQRYLSSWFFGGCAFCFWLMVQMKLKKAVN